MCFVQTLQRVKVYRLSREQRGFYECTGIGQNKISFSTFGAGLLVIDREKNPAQKRRDFLREMEAKPLRLELRWTHVAQVHPIWCQRH